jgi:hypothetical protein
MTISQTVKIALLDSASFEVVECFNRLLYPKFKKFSVFNVTKKCSLKEKGF